MLPVVFQSNNKQLNDDNFLRHTRHTNRICLLISNIIYNFIFGIYYIKLCAQAEAKNFGTIKELTCNPQVYYFQFGS